jgi:SAM-dependent methyltransferase
MTVQTEIDPAKVGEFAGKALGDMSAAMLTVMAALGDRVGLFKDLATNGPATSEELAVRTGTNERYVREWLGCLAAGGYLQYRPEDGRFALPAEHAPVLALEGTPFSVGGAYQLFLAEIAQAGRLSKLFKTGGGIPVSDYDESLFDGQDRFSAGWVDGLLTQVWIPTIPGLREKLERGVAVADIGCGRGRALIKLAETYPNSYFVGYDQHQPAVDVANERARTAGVAERARFQRLDATAGLPARFDVVTAFDVVHDTVSPVGLLRAIRESLNPDGVFVCLETACSENLSDNFGPIGTLFHAISIMYCLTTSLAHDGAGLGTLGLPESKLRDLGREAGFSRFARVTFDSPFNSVYEMRT